MKKIKVTGDNLTFDLLLWRLHGVQGQTLVERTMRLNPQLTEAFLPLGADITLPERIEAPVKPKAVVTLFG